MTITLQKEPLIGRPGTLRQFMGNERTLSRYDAMRNAFKKLVVNAATLPWEGESEEQDREKMVAAATAGLEAFERAIRAGRSLDTAMAEGRGDFLSVAEKSLGLLMRQMAVLNKKAGALEEQITAILREKETYGSPD